MPPPTPVISAKKAAVTRSAPRCVAASAPVAANTAMPGQVEPGQDRAELPRRIGHQGIVLGISPLSIAICGVEQSQRPRCAIGAGDAALRNGKQRLMQRYQPAVHRGRAICLAALAGFVDALAYISLGGFFASFMSGNTTRLGVGLATARFARARAWRAR